MQESGTDTEFFKLELNVVRLKVKVGVKVRKVPKMGALLASHWLSLSQPFRRSYICKEYFELSSTPSYQQADLRVYRLYFDKAPVLLGNRV